MKDKQIKLFGAYGDYIPGFFKISIDKKLFEGITWNDFNSEEKATLVHEYVHFLQDISTTRGINNFLHVSKILQLNFAKAYEQAGEFILLPFDFEIIGAEDAYVESELQSFYMGDSKHIKVHHIDRICREEEELINGIVNNEKLFAINIFYDNKEHPYVLGNTAIAESMAYLIETYKFGGLRRQNEFPYNICEMICKKECSLLYENKALLVAACELSLMHYHSGDMFWHILAEINQHDLAFNQVSEFKTYFFERTYFLYQNMNKECEEIKNVLDFLYPVKNPILSEINKKVYSFLRRGLGYRDKNKLFISEIMESNDAVKVFHLWMQYFGMPILCDQNNEIFAGSDLAAMVGPFALYNFFMRRDGNSCDIEAMCKTQGIKNYDSNVCTICPWQQAEKDELCLFGMYWHMYSLTGKIVKRK